MMGKENGNGNGTWKTYTISALGALVLILGGFVLQDLAKRTENLEKNNADSRRVEKLEEKLADIGRSRDERTVEIANIKAELAELRRSINQK